MVVFYTSINLLSEVLLFMPGYSIEHVKSIKRAGRSIVIFRTMLISWLLLSDDWDKTGQRSFTNNRPSFEVQAFVTNAMVSDQGQ